MNKWLPFFIFIISFAFTQEVELSIDNFIDNGDGTATFDMMMINTQEVGGFQWDFISGDGIFDSAANGTCICKDNAVPEDCDECYFDIGYDRVQNNSEVGYTSTSSIESDCGDGDYDCCSTSGVCTNASFSSSSDCLEEGVCSDVTVGFCDDSDTELGGYGSTFCDPTAISGQCVRYQCLDGAGSVTGFSTEESCIDGDSENTWSGIGNTDCIYKKTVCEDSGVCSNSDEEGECSCIFDGGVWESNYWVPEDLWAPNNSYEVCEANGFDWKYRNLDPNFDNYGTFDDNDYSGDAECTYTGWLSSDEYCENNDPFCTVRGECSFFEPACISNGDSEAAGTPAGEELNWPAGCCNSTFGGTWVEAARDRDLCLCGVGGSWKVTGLSGEGECESGSTGSALGDWTQFNTEELCTANGGWLLDNEDGTEGNDSYDSGELFYDGKTDVSFSRTAGFGFQPVGDNNFAFGVTLVDGRVIGVSITGDTYLITDTPQVLISEIIMDMTAYSDGQVELSILDICIRDGFNCPAQLIISDSAGNELTSDFQTVIITKSGDALSVLDADLGDGICSESEAEAFEIEAVCESVCGDGYCDSVTSNETYIGCATDCLSTQGDGFCQWGLGENNTNAPEDCIIFGCGDYVCSDGEDYSTCSQDCGSSCGDGQCTEGESSQNCTIDCNAGCGDGTCELGVEDFINCDADCNTFCGDGYYDYLGIGGTEDEACTDYYEVCGDGYYDHAGILDIEDIPGTEDETCVSDYTEACGDGYYDHSGIGGTEDETCTEDYMLTDGDGYCDTALGEDPSDQDCSSICGDGFYHHVGLGGTEDGDCEDFDPRDGCGDGVCSRPYENMVNCPECESMAGDGFCNSESMGFGGDETSSSAPTDCAPVCGDAVCAVFNNANPDILETFLDCSVDCDSCGDGFCDSIFLENLADCPVDCAVCGDNYCTEGFEDYSSCPDDCAPTLGCKDDESACNYDATVDIHDVALCTYAAENFDCDGICTADLDCLMVCGGMAVADCNGDCNGPASLDGEGNCLNIDLLAPITFSLSNNYPNPFNPVTSIEYSVEKPGYVNISIYNIMGHKVFDLVSGYHSPGVRYSAAWNSNTQSNIPVSTGIYFYEMRSGDYVERKKMVLVK